MKKINKIKGLIAAPYTPMRADGSINPEAIKGYAARLKADGLRGVFICGTTGEGMLMTTREREEIAENWVREQEEDFRVIVHVGTTSARQSKELSRHAQLIGAYGTGCMGPLFLRPGNISGLVAYCNEVASGSPELPFYYYYMPRISGETLPVFEFLKEASQRISNFTGIKFTHNNFMEMQQCLGFEEGKWDILHGFDEVLLAGLSLGAEGAVGSTYNFMAPLYLQMMKDVENNDLEKARIKQNTSVRIIEIMERYNGTLVAGKNLMKSFGVDCGPCRLPLPNLTDSMQKDLVNEIENTGLLKKGFPEE